MPQFLEDRERGHKEGDSISLLSCGYTNLVLASTQEVRRYELTDQLLEWSTLGTWPTLGTQQDRSNCHPNVPIYNTVSL